MSEWDKRFREHAIFQTVSHLKDFVRNLMKKYRTDIARYDGLERIVFVVSAVDGKLKSAQPQTVSFAALDLINQNLDQANQQLAIFFDLVGDEALSFLSLANGFIDTVINNLPIIDGAYSGAGGQMSTLFTWLREDSDQAIQGLIAERDQWNAAAIQLQAQVEELMSQLSG